MAREPLQRAASVSPDDFNERVKRILKDRELPEAQLKRAAEARQKPKWRK